MITTKQEQQQAMGMSIESNKRIAALH